MRLLFYLLATAAAADLDRKAGIGARHAHAHAKTRTAVEDAALRRDAAAASLMHRVTTPGPCGDCEACLRTNKDRCIPESRIPDAETCAAKLDTYEWCGDEHCGNCDGCRKSKASAPAVCEETSRPRRRRGAGPTRLRGISTW